MAENQNRTDVVNTTDWYEAAKVFNGRKVLFSTIILICLLVLQLAFWANHLGWTDKEHCPCDNCVQARQVHECCCSSAKVCADCQSKLEAEPAAQEPAEELTDPMPESTPPTEVTAVIDAAEETEPAAAKSNVDIQKLQTELEQTAAQITGQPLVDIDETSIPGTTEDADTEVVEKEKSPGLSMPFPKPNCYVVAAVVKVCNYILILFSVLYCLTLLMAIQVSLCGSLGGLEHISRSFFCALFMVIIILPWQYFLPGYLVGMIYAPSEILTGVCSEKTPSAIADFLYYLRFSGLWLLVLITLISANVRSGKWYRTVQKRLGILH